MRKCLRHNTYAYSYSTAEFRQLRTQCVYSGNGAHKKLQHLRDWRLQRRFVLL